MKESKIFQNITINKVQTTIKDNVKYLGITLDKRLTFKLSTDLAINNAYNVLRTMYYLIKKNSKLSISNKKTHIPYASQTHIDIRSTNMEQYGNYSQTKTSKGSEQIFKTHQ